jgi:hypothetical protein
MPEPIDDGDRHTDVYLRTPPDDSGYSGGREYTDPFVDGDAAVSAYIYMTPDLEGRAFRFRAAHELAHVLMRAAFGGYASQYEESLANWMAQFALPDAGPDDNDFATPFTPLDCTRHDWNGTPCGDGYWQWLFFERQAEDLGPGFMAAVLRRAGADHEPPGDFVARALQDELAARTGLAPTAALAARYADYARKVWDPTTWTSAAAQEVFARYGRPTADEVVFDERLHDSGARSVSVDHLAARYAELWADASPDDDVRIRVTPPAGVDAAPDVLTGPDAGPRADVALEPVGADGSFAKTIPMPSSGGTVVIPFVNDSATADGRTWWWHARLLPATARLTVRAQPLRSALEHGLRVRIMTSKPAVVRLTVSRGATVVAHATRRLRTAATASVPMRLRPPTRLIRANRPRVIVSGTARFPRGTIIDLRPIMVRLA